MHLYKTNKKVLSFCNNPAIFLKGITSNTIEAPRNAFLSIHGKVIGTFDQVKISDDEIWICLEETYVPAVLSHIDKYVKLARVDVQSLDRSVYFDLEDDYPVHNGEIAIPQKRGKLIVTPNLLNANVSDAEFTAFRLENSIPLQGVDYQDDFILNVSYQDYVSFTKGCYLGQEPVSKVYNRSKPTWRLVVKDVEYCTAEERSKMTSIAQHPKTGAISGFVFEKNQ